MISFLGYDQSLGLSLQGSKQMRETKDEAAKIDALKFPLW